MNDLLPTSRRWSDGEASPGAMFITMVCIALTLLGIAALWLTLAL